MIVCDREEFVFVHIPKCAGTTVRMQIDHLDSYGGRFCGIRRHERLGTVNYQHLPLDVLASEFPEIHDKLRAYDGYAMIRDPFERFGSSVAQSMRYFSQRRLSDLSEAELRDAVAGFIDRLADPDNRLKIELWDFLPQVDFLIHDGEQIVEHVFDVSESEAFMSAVSSRLDIELDVKQRRNQDLSFRWRALLRPAYHVNSLLARYAPRRLHQSVKRFAAPLLIHGDSAARKTGVLDIPGVREFVERHYARDFEFRAALAAKR